MDPNESAEIKQATTRQAVRKLVNNGVIVKLPVKIRSRYRWRIRRAAISKGRHTGMGCRRGTANARNPSKLQWVKRIRILRRVLRKYRNADKIDKHLYRELYLKAKGNVFKGKKNLIEHVFKAKEKIEREKKIKQELEAKKEKMAKLKSLKEEKEKKKAKKIIEEADEAAKLQKEQKE
jgi:large subunit ribosomal protein L19e